MRLPRPAGEENRQGKLLEERYAARTVAQCSLDDAASVANGRAAKFAARHPGSVYATRVNRTVFHRFDHCASKWLWQRGRHAGRPTVHDGQMLSCTNAGGLVAGYLVGPRRVR
jgi:hypothetical protein